MVATAMEMLAVARLNLSSRPLLWVTRINLRAYPLGEYPMRSGADAWCDQDGRVHMDEAQLTAHDGRARWLVLTRRGYEAIFDREG